MANGVRERGGVSYLIHTFVPTPQEFARLYKQYRQERAGMFFTLPVFLLMLRLTVAKFFSLLFTMWEKTPEGSDALTKVIKGDEEDIEVWHKQHSRGPSHPSPDLSPSTLSSACVACRWTPHCSTFLTHTATCSVTSPSSSHLQLPSTSSASIHTRVTSQSTGKRMGRKSAGEDAGEEDSKECMERPGN